MVATLVPRRAGAARRPADRAARADRLALPALRAQVPHDRRRAQRANGRHRCGSATAAIVELGVRLDNPWVALACFVAMGPIHARFAILMHEAAHKLLFTSKRANDASARGCSPTRRWCRSRSTGGATSRTTGRSSAPTSPTWRSTRATPVEPRDLLRRLLARRGRASRAGRTSRSCCSRRARPRAAGSLSPILGGPGRAVRRPVGRHRRVVGLPGVLVAQLDDPVARAQPAARDRRARRHGGGQGPARDDPQRAPALARAALVRALQHRLAPRAPRRHGRAVAQPARRSTRSCDAPAT